MVSFKAKITLPKITSRKIQKIVRDFADQEMQNAIRHFLKAMLAKIPIRTGFLSGSFIKIAAKYGLAHNPIGENPKGEIYRHSSLRILKGPESGQDFASDPETTYKKYGNRFWFSVNNYIIYWRINEFFSRIPGSPWRSIEAGEDAFIDYLISIGDRFPGITDQLDIFTVTLGKNQTRATIRQKRTPES